MLTALARRWWVLLLNGLCAIVFGFLALAWPGVTLVVLIVLFGGYCISDGVTALVVSRARHRDGRPWGQMLFVGIVSILAGITAFVWPGITAFALLFVIAVWAVVRGILEIYAAIELRRVIRNEWLLVLAGVISILFGFALVTQPGAGALAVTWLIGTFAIVSGTLLTALAFRVRAFAHRHVPHW